MVMVW